MGLTLLGASLIIGLFVRFSSLLGVLLMALYYIPLGFPYPNPNSYIVDQHIIYIAVLFFFAAIRAGRVFGLDSKRPPSLRIQKMAGIKLLTHFYLLKVK